MIRIDDENNHGTYWYTVSEIAKVIGMKDENNRYVGRNKMYKLLRDEKILMENGNYPYQQYIVLGIVQMYRKTIGNYTVFMPIFSMRGVNYLKNRFNKV